jgi:hypothetical protein
MSSTEALPLKDEQSVFLNVPFDIEYSPLFIALVAGLTGLGRKPRSVLEVPSGGLNRLERIFSLIASCGASVHDLSRVGLSGDFQVPRFNMPFELGMAYALSRQSPHSFYILEEKHFRLQASLSDLNGYDPHIHAGNPTDVLRCVLDCFRTPAGAPPLTALETLRQGLMEIVLDLQKEGMMDGLFHRHVFLLVVATATEIARRDGLIQ